MSNRFADYTRSTAYNMRLSNAMVQSLLVHANRQQKTDIEQDLAATFNWYEPFAESVFIVTTALEVLTRATGTERALYNRGLLDIRRIDDPEKLDTPRTDGREPHLLVTSKPGMLQAKMLLAAGFPPVEPNIQKVRLHPDDRRKIVFNRSLDTVTIDDVDDRRLKLVKPHQQPYLVGVQQEWDVLKERVDREVILESPPEYDWNICT